MLFKKRIYLPVTLVIGLMLFVFWRGFNSIEQQKDDGLVINLAGRQRMLSQKMTKEILVYMNASDSLKLLRKKDVLTTMDVFDITLNALKNSGEAPLSLDLITAEYRYCPKAKEPAYSQLAKVEKVWEGFSEVLDTILNGSPVSEETYDFVMQQNILLLTEMNHAVDLMQILAEKKVSRLLLIQVITILIALFLAVYTFIGALIAEKADLANKAKSVFLSNMSHEIRTPMNGILGFTEILQGKENDPVKRKFLETIQTSGRSLLALINDILDLSKVEAGKLELQYSTISTASLFNELETLFSYKVTEIGVLFNVTLDETVPELLVTDATRLRQVLINLISNAVKFTHQGYINVSVKGVQPNKNQSGRVTLVMTIEDSGVGIRKDQQRTIFEPFEQSKGQDQNTYGGTGLGLAISKQIIELMGGTISLKSTPGKGTLFSISIPDVQVVYSPLSQNTEPLLKDHDSIEFKPATILIVDDIEYNREIMAAYLGSYDFTLIFAENGEEAVKKSIEYLPDLIFMDIKMPVMGGEEASEIIKSREETNNIPIIAVTASVMKEQERTIKKSCDDLLRKPLEKRVLIQRLLHYLPTVDQTS